MTFNFEAKVPEPVNCSNCSFVCAPKHLVSVLWDRSKNSFAATFLCSSCGNVFTVQTHSNEKVKERNTSLITAEEEKRFGEIISSPEGQRTLLEKLKEAEERGGNNATSLK